MNKKEFIRKLKEQINYSEEKCYIINEILESNFFLSKKSKNKIIEDLINQLDIDTEEANGIYNIAVKIINDEIKNKLRHPFKSKD